MSMKGLLKEMQAPLELNMTPMIDMSFLLIIFFICLPMKSLASKLQAFLPTDKGITPTKQEPPLEIKVSVHIVARAEREMVYPPPRPQGQEDKVPRGMEKVPQEFRYKVGNSAEDVGNLKEVFEYIKRAYAAARDNQEAKIIGEIKAGYKVPHKYVIAVLNKFAEAGLVKVEFYGAAFPPPNLRKSPYLPYPKANYGTVDGG